MITAVDSLKPIRDDYQKSYRGTSDPASQGQSPPYPLFT